MRKLSWPGDFMNKVICGDCLELMEKIPDHSIDLIQADPPFNFKQSQDHGGEYSKSSWLYKHGKTHLKRIQGAFGHDFQPEEYLEASIRVMKKYNAYWWCSKELVPRYINWANKKGFSFNILMWHKPNPLPLWNGNYLPDTEYCIFMRKKGAYFDSTLDDWRKYSKYHVVSSGHVDKGHPCVKPLFIIKTQVEISCPPAGIVLDPFVGSGTTAVAAKELGRRFIAMEINPTFHRLAEQRLSQGVL